MWAAAVRSDPWRGCAERGAGVGRAKGYEVGFQECLDRHRRQWDSYFFQTSKSAPSPPGHRRWADVGDRAESDIRVGRVWGSGPGVTRATKVVLRTFHRKSRE